jgi:hypothetical protein
MLFIAKSPVAGNRNIARSIGARVPTKTTRCSSLVCLAAFMQRQTIPSGCKKL